RNFQDYYQKSILKNYQKYFPSLVSYNRFVELMPDALLPLICYLNTRKGQCSGISFIDSMGIPICHNKRAKRNKVFRGLSGWGKSSVDWYFGFKLHLIIFIQLNCESKIFNFGLFSLVYLLSIIIAN
ncbi:MAG: transposase, partial [Dolichospermum sp.]